MNTVASGSAGDPPRGSGPSSLDKRGLRPREGPRLTRIGRDRDGGYVVPEGQIRPCRWLLSLGLSDDPSFERDFLSRNPRVRILGVDDRVGAWFLARRLVASAWKAAWNTLVGNSLKRRVYVESVLGCLAIPRLFRPPHRRIRGRVGSGEQRGELAFGDLLAAAGGSPRKAAEPDVFLKMDIEGSEYGVVPDIGAHASRIRCIAAEFHHLDRRTDEFNAALRDLAEDFVIVHVHGNNFTPWDPRIDFPTAIEITLVNRSVLDRDLPPSTAELPRPGLDRPCHPGRDDYRLSFD